jgi:SAM-dependent methyltransferase
MSPRIRRAKGARALSLRSTFDEDAELYDRARPAYPDALFNDLAEWLPAGSRLLEIGCGTGQATRALAARGYRVTCVELGARLAEVARRQGFDVLVADFDTWEPPERYDGVVAFTMFHWLDRATRFARAAAAAPILAVVETQHVLPPDGDPFFLEVQADYDELDRGGGAPPGPAGPDTLEVEPPFRLIAERRYRHDIEYTADEYLAVLSTYSGHIAMPAARREELFRRIRARIGGGTVRKSYEFALTVAAAS